MSNCRRCCQVNNRCAACGVKSSLGSLFDNVSLDIAFHPSGDTLLATFSGFSESPLYRSVNGGLSWTPFGEGLPHIPTNCVIYDPYESRHVYLGNDLGVFFSEDGGQQWEPFNSGLPEATLIMDLAVSLPNYSIRAATHGHGVYEHEPQ